jgi:hypothetical protein
MKASGVFVRGKVARKQQEKRFPTAAAIARHGSRIHDQADGIAKGKHSPRLSGIIPDAEPLYRRAEPVARQLSPFRSLPAASSVKHSR